MASAAGLHLRADYTFTQADDEVLHEELLRRPKHKATLNAAWQLMKPVAGWHGALRGQLDRRQSRFFDSAADGSGVCHGEYGGEFRAGLALTVFGRIDNLFDRHYQDPVGFLHPAFGVFMGVRGQLRP